MRSKFYNEIIHPIIENILNHPDNQAFYIGDKYFSYYEFGQSISRIRNLINANLIENSSEKIGLIVYDDLETYASILAIWLEGCSYVPIHPNQPIIRGQSIIDSVGIRIVLASEELIKFDNGTIIYTKNYNTKLALSDLVLREKLVFREQQDTELAYILFTSGSTGNPKGVMLNRTNIAHFMQSFWLTGIELDSKDKCLQCFDLTFDVSIQGFLAPLIRGACCYTVPLDVIKYHYVANLIEEKRISFGAFPPSMARLMRPYLNELDFSSLKICIFTAEASHLSLLDEWKKCAFNSTIYNFYGPTEGTIYCTFYKFNNEKNNSSHNGILTVGNPMSGVDIIILNEDKAESKIGEKGELCISGPQITPGYWNDEFRNNDVFFNFNFRGEMRRFYKTGDLCYLNNSKEIMYIGRIDNQIKINGYRVELGEIEYTAQKYLGGVNCVAIAFDSENGNISIFLFVESKPLNAMSILNDLRGKLPNYMIPSRIVFLEKFPLNQNEKVDRNQLKKNGLFV